MDIKQLTKKCSKCGKIKPLNEFSKDKYRKDGKCFYCKECIAGHYQKNKQKISKRHKKYRQENWQKELKQCRIRYQKDKKKIRKRRKELYGENRNKYLQYSKKYREANREKCRESSKKSYDKDKRNEYQKKYQREKRRTDLKFNLNNRMSSAIGKSLKGNKLGKHWENLVDYTVIDLIKGLKKTMPKGYTWQDFLDSKLHIDHIIPKKVFNFTKPEHPDFRHCWALSNLQLLPVRENLSKQDKLKNPFQPCLAI